jgi:hypothetical protein
VEGSPRRRPARPYRDPVRRLAAIIGDVEISRAQAAQLHDLLRDELIKQMVPAGWAVDVAQDTGSGGPLVAAFRRPISPDFAATAEFVTTSFGPPGKAPCVEVVATVGVSFEPAYRLWPVVCDRDTSDLTTEVGALLNPPTDWGVSLSRAADAPVAARDLVAPVLEHALPYANRFADVDALIAENRSDPDEFGWQAEVVPLLLAAAGRSDEARRSLAGYLASGREEVASNQYRRFAYQLNRWLDAGSALPAPPTGPVGSRPTYEPTASPLPSFSEVRRTTHARRDAVEAVRHGSKGKDRDERREMLVAELAQRGLDVSPLAVETMLDRIDISGTTFGRIRQTGRGLKMLAGAGSGIGKLLRHGPVAPPAWLQPPPRACYPARTGHRSWTAVELDKDAGAWLDRVFTASPNQLNSTVNVDAWVVWDPEPRIPRSRLAVHLGTERVGVLDPVTSERFEPVMKAAAARQELPCLRARLTSLGDRSYLLEVPAP